MISVWMISMSTAKASLADLRQGSLHCSPAKSVQTNYKTAQIALKAIVTILPLKRKKHEVLRIEGREKFENKDLLTDRVSLTMNNKKAAMQTI